MLKFNFEDPKSDMSSVDIAWYNMKIADEYHKLDYFIAAAFGWLNIFTDKNFQDLEKELRCKKFNTHLIAKLRKDINCGCDIKLPNRNNADIKCEYECIFSCRPSKLAHDEVLSVWNTYDDNFNALKNAGSIVINDSVPLIDNDKIETVDNEINLLSNNKKNYCR